MAAEEIVPHAKDRRAWRKIVIACFAAKGDGWSVTIKNTYFSSEVCLFVCFLFYLDSHVILFELI